MADFPLDPQSIYNNQNSISAQITVQNRDPTASDNQYAIGTFWVSQAPQGSGTLFCLNGIVNGVPDWVASSGGASPVDFNALVTFNGSPQAIQVNNGSVNLTNSTLNLDSGSSAIFDAPVTFQADPSGEVVRFALGNGTPGSGNNDFINFDMSDSSNSVDFNMGGQARIPGPYIQPGTVGFFSDPVYNPQALVTDHLSYSLFEGPVQFGQSSANGGIQNRSYYLSNLIELSGPISYVLNRNEIILCNSSAGAISIDLGSPIDTNPFPVVPLDGYTIKVMDIAGTASVNNITIISNIDFLYCGINGTVVGLSGIYPNAQMGIHASPLIMNQNYQCLTLIFSAAIAKWIVQP